MQACSEDLRARIVRAAAGTPHAELKRILGVSLATIGRYVRLARAGRSLQPKTLPGPKVRIGPAERPALLAQLAAAGPDTTLDEHCALWLQAHGVRVSPQTMSRLVRQLCGWTRKKRVCAPASKTPPSGPLGARAPKQS